MCALRQARILSSETDSTIKQEQNTNINIKVQQTKPTPPPTNTNNNNNQNTGIAYQGSGYIPNIQPANFITAPPMDAQQYPSVPVIDNSFQERSIPNSLNFEEEIEKLTIKNQFLELLLHAYSENPLKINSLVVCNNKTLIEMVKLLTSAERVDLIINDDIGCECGCTPNNSEIVYVSKILITKDGSTTDLKYSHNDVYSEFTKFAISTKIVSV